jgi:hypothetical protein
LLLVLVLVHGVAAWSSTPLTTDACNGGVASRPALLFIQVDPEEVALLQARLEAGEEIGPNKTINWRSPR